MGGFRWPPRRPEAGPPLVLLPPRRRRARRRAVTLPLPSLLAPLFLLALLGDAFAFGFVEETEGDGDARRVEDDGVALDLRRTLDIDVTDVDDACHAPH